MKELTLIRHGRAAAGWDEDRDPGLDSTGRSQAAAMAAALKRYGPRPLVVSPLRRTRETAAALEEVWGVEARVDPDVGEIPSPTDALEERGAWLRAAMRGVWSAQPEALRQWRDRVIAALQSFDDGTVVVTHFIAINAAVGMATGDDRLVCFTPGYCSRTTITVDGTKLAAVEFGTEDVTVVN